MLTVISAVNQLLAFCYSAAVFVVVQLVGLHHKSNVHSREFLWPSLVDK